MNRGDELIRNIIADRNSNSCNELLKEMFHGYPVENLKRLLSHEDERVKKAGVWVLSELGESAASLIDDAVPLLSHPSDYVRYYAMDCILSCARAKDGPAIVAVLPMLNDVDMFNRQRAMWFLMNISEEPLRAGLVLLKQELRNDEHSRGLELLLSGAQSNLDDVFSLLQSDNAITRRYAVAAAARLGTRGRNVLNTAALHSTDEDIRKFAEHVPTTLAWRRCIGES